MQMSSHHPIEIVNLNNLIITTRNAKRVIAFKRGATFESEFN